MANSNIATIQQVTQQEELIPVYFGNYGVYHSFNTSFEPVIKWSGSKRSQLKTILSYVPKFETLYEPFVGSCAVTYAISPFKGICGDIYKPLIEFWNAVKYSPKQLADSYEIRWSQLQNDGYTTFYKIRDRFNKAPNPEDLLFLSRTCVNGLIRFNKNGEFNNALHHTRKGIDPNRLRKVIMEWSSKIQGISFQNVDYRESTKNATSNDFIYLDPPYFNNKARYCSDIDYDTFIEYLRDLNSRGIKYALSYDGYRGDKNYMVELPKDVYQRHIMIKSGPASFRKVIDKTNEAVYESLYLNF